MSPINFSKPPSLAARRPPWTISPASSGAPTPRRQIDDADAEALSRPWRPAGRSWRASGVDPMRPKAAGPPRASRRREKMFGLGRPRALDRNAKVRIMHWARCLSRRTEKGRAYGVVTAKAVAVLEALLWVFHNNRSGLCFPSYETIAQAAHCARSTVAEALQALENAGVFSWVQRIKRVREPCPDLLGDDGWRWRVLRTSNSYAFADPSPAGPAKSSKSEKPTGTANQAFFSSLGPPSAAIGPAVPAGKGLCEGKIAGFAPDKRAYDQMA